MIGILAGMGPKSTAPFIAKIIEKCQIMYGVKFDIEFPPMMIYSCPTPFFINRTIKHEELEKAIVEGAKRLEATGVDFIAIPCNIAHIYFSQIESAVKIPVLNVVFETLKRIPTNCEKVAILGTASTIDANIYQTSLGNADFQFVQKKDWQETVSKILMLIKDSSYLQEAVMLWEKLGCELKQEVDVVILACTDLQIVADNAKKQGLLLVDSAVSLAEAVVEKYYTSLNHIH